MARTQRVRKAVAVGFLALLGMGTVAGCRLELRSDGRVWRICERSDYTQNPQTLDWTVTNPFAALVCPGIPADFGDQLPAPRPL